jgi:hypothetical protein
MFSSYMAVFERKIITISFENNKEITKTKQNENNSSPSIKLNCFLCRETLEFFIKKSLFSREK